MVDNLLDVRIKGSFSKSVFHPVTSLTARPDVLFDVAFFGIDSIYSVVNKFLMRFGA